jgi:hypothetical protein
VGGGADAELLSMRDSGLEWGFKLERDAGCTRLVEIVVKPKKDMLHDSNRLKLVKDTNSRMKLDVADQRWLMNGT